MKISDEKYDSIVEQLAAIEHRRWSNWQTFVHEQCIHTPEGNLIIPQKCVERWNRQISTPYSELSEDEKQSDRNQVNLYLPHLLDILGIKRD